MADAYINNTGIPNDKLADIKDPTLRGLIQSEKSAHRDLALLGNRADFVQNAFDAATDFKLTGGEKEGLMQKLNEIVDAENQNAEMGSL
ncbi:MAG: hypothetical protein GY822_02745 [Deltaproteobacteria bacterium]|nr:hypothetical protein [Deltaproteobacteria bacterium]